MHPSTIHGRSSPEDDDSDGRYTRDRIRNDGRRRGTPALHADRPGGHSLRVGGPGNDIRDRALGPVRRGTPAPKKFLGRQANDLDPNGRNAEDADNGLERSESEGEESMDSRAEDLPPLRRKRPFAEEDEEAETEGEEHATTRLEDRISQGGCATVSAYEHFVHHRVNTRETAKDRRCGYRHHKPY